MLNLVSVTQCRGSTFDPNQSLIIADHLGANNYELRTAAADGLLKCGIELLEDKRILNTTLPLSPEARYSILLIKEELAEEKPNSVEEITGLDPNEMQRRLRWQQQRFKLADRAIATKEGSDNN